MDNPNQALIDSGKKLVIAVTGGGQSVIGELTKYGGMSNTLLEAIVPYSLPAYYKLVGGKLDHIVSSASARCAAMACYMKAREYTPDNEVVGIASTASLAKVGGEREGREHKAFIGIQTKYRTLDLSIRLNPGLTRDEEEEVVTKCIGEAVKWGFYIFGDVQKQLGNKGKCYLQSNFQDGEIHDVIHGIVNRTKCPPSKIIFSSSLNPLHDGHLGIIEHAARKFHHPVDIELCVVNPDKPPLDYLTIFDRIYDTQNKTAGNPYVGNIIVTNKPFFFDKVDLFPGAMFVVGADTYNRIVNPIYYRNHSQDIVRGILKLKKAGSKIIIYPREGYHVSDSSIYENVVEKIEDYVENNISSTEIRRKNYVNL